MSILLGFIGERVVVDLFCFLESIRGRLRLLLYKRQNHASAIESGKIKNRFPSNSKHPNLCKFFKVKTIYAYNLYASQTLLDPIPLETLKMQRLGVRLLHAASAGSVATCGSRAQRPLIRTSSACTWGVADWTASQLFLKRDWLGSWVIRLQVASPISILSILI